MAKHINDGACKKCAEIFERYPGFHAGLRSWFEALQRRFKDAHISCAGRGKSDQELFFKRGSSKAKWGQSSHNFNRALDIFQLDSHGAAAWPRNWFTGTVEKAVDEHNADPKKTFSITWYGKSGSKFFELPHIEDADWRQDPNKKLVE